MGRAAFIYDDVLSRHELRSDHPMRPVRLRYTYELLQEYSAFDHPDAVLHDPRMATDQELLWLHTTEYVAAVKALGSDATDNIDAARFGFSTQGDNPVYPNMFEAAALSTGASLVAAEMVSNKTVDAAFNISGGLHHAGANQASGFCVFNDPALAVHYFLSQGHRVAYVDIDAHHGDGVQEVFYDDERVLTISIHESGQWLFPGTGSVSEIGEGPGRGFAVNIPLYPYTSDDDYVEAFGQVVTPLVVAFAPDILVTQLGIDSYHNDPLTHLQVTTVGYIAAVRQLAGLGLPWLALGGGGYDVSAVARAWTLVYGVMLGAEWPDQLPLGFSEEHRVARLRDQVSPKVPSEIKIDARRYMEDVVGAIRQEIFPLHGLV